MFIICQSVGRWRATHDWRSTFAPPAIPLLPQAFTTLAHALTCSTVDFCNMSFAGLGSSCTSQLQSVLCCSLDWWQSGHISTYILEHLHWLPTPERILSKTLVFLCNCLTGCTLIYLKEPWVLISSVPDHRPLQSVACRDLIVPKTRTATVQLHTRCPCLRKCPSCWSLMEASVSISFSFPQALEDCTISH